MGDGAPRREHLLAVERITKKRPLELDGVELPPETAHVWSWFISLHRARGSNGMGPNPISYSDVAAFAGLTGIIIRQVELDALFEIDQLWLASQAKKNDS